MSRARARRRKQARADARKLLIAPPGTPVDGPGWYEPPAGMVLAWDIDGTCPDVAVKRGGVLLASGVPFGPQDWGSLVRGVMRGADGILRVSGTDPMVLLEQPGIIADMRAARAMIERGGIYRPFDQ